MTLLFIIYSITSYIGWKKYIIFQNTQYLSEKADFMFSIRNNKFVSIGSIAFVCAPRFMSYRKRKHFYIETYIENFFSMLQTQIK